MARVYNFSAGPAVLPEEVLKEAAAEMLDYFGIDYEVTVISAHRMPDVFFDYAKTAKEKGFKFEPGE